MILSEKIMTLRKKCGWSQEELADKMDISRQSVSKWESGMSIPDLDKILKLSELFGVSTDYLLKDECNEINPQEDGGDKDEVLKVSVEEANRYMDTVKSICGKIAIATSMCILSPVCLIILGGFSEYKGNITEDMAGGIGVAVLLIIIAAAVGMFIFFGTKTSRYNYIEKEKLSLQYGVVGIVQKRKAEYEDEYRKNLVIGTILCILSVIPNMVGAAFGLGDFGMILCVSSLFISIAAGVNIFVRTCMIYGSFEKLLQTGDYTAEEKEISKKIGFFSGAYWCIATAIYLLISFTQNNWESSWIVWPVEGVLFAAVYGIIKAIVRRKIRG